MTRRRISAARRLVLALALGVASPFAASADPPEVAALLRHLDDLYRSSSSIARIEIAVVNPRSTRTMRLRAWTRGEEEALVVVEAPAREAGTATLRVGQNLWNWLPRISRTIRVPPAMMLASWMGTDFTNDDLVKESSLHDDFTARIERRSESPPGWWLGLDVKPASSAAGPGSRCSSPTTGCRWRSGTTTARVGSPAR